MSKKLYTLVIVIIALVLAVLATVWPQERLADIIYISRFFDVMLPVLGVGALIKYLSTWKCCKGGCGNCGKAGCGNCGKGSCGTTTMQGNCGTQDQDHEGHNHHHH